MRGTTTAGLFCVLLFFPATWPIGLSVAEDPEKSGFEEHELEDGLRKEAGPEAMDDGEELMDDGSSLADMQKELEAMGDDSVPGEPVSKHPKGNECISKVEEIEESISLFDKKGMGKDTIREVVDGMKKIADHMLGKKSKGDFADKFHETLLDVHARSGTFGAVDSCKVMLEHHDEL